MYQYPFNDSHKIGVIGLGFVGLPLALLLVDKGFHVTGIDIDETKITKINKGETYLPDISNEELNSKLSSNRFHVTSDYNVVSTLDVIIISVPTPLSENNEPNLEFLISVSNKLAPLIKKEQIFILESSTYPGTTTEIFKPILEKSGLEVGKDIFICYSPERIDPGNFQFSVTEIPKLISGVTKKCLLHGQKIYEQVFQRVVPVSSTEVAEFTKLLENCYRFINISFINELAILCDQLNIDLWEAISAASTKPYGYSPFYPGPGIGGHCIPVDPLYLQWKAKESGYMNQFIKLSDEVNKTITTYISTQIKKLLAGKENSKVLIYGVTYKKNTNDIRQSPAIDEIIPSLLKVNVNVTYTDPFIPELNICGENFKSIKVTKENLQNYDCVVILTDHLDPSLDLILEHAKLIYDTRNVTASIGNSPKIIRLGSGKN
ncbi:nucleotide sugar dehydrogenase [Metabacillus fastidiosus]|uniref:nucleotide sugar dehydrogenase n=1 Tax=Metabacillus fastidiosus TaxID=1458 RepID=UPI003D2DA7B3